MEAQHLLCTLITSNMIKAPLIFLFVVTTLTFCNAQEINMFKAGGGAYHFSQYDKTVSLKELSHIMEPNADAFKLIKKARSGFGGGNILGFAGGGLIGYPVGTAVAGGNANWTLAGVGVGLLAIAIPLSIRARKNAEQAVNLFNSSFSSSSRDQLKPTLRVSASGNAIGLSLIF